LVVPSLVTDAATIADLSYVLDQDHVPFAYSWAHKCAFDTTCLLLSLDGIGIAQGLTQALPAGVHGQVQRQLGDLIRPLTISPATRLQGLLDTQKWAQSNSQTIRDFVYGNAEDESGFSLNDLVPAFLESERRHWIATAREMNGLFDREFYRSLAHCFGEPESVISKLNRRIGEDPALLKDPERAFGRDGTELIEKCFLAAVLLRGSFRDYCSRELQVIHHPYRSAMLSSSTAVGQAQRFEATNTVRATSALLLEAGFNKGRGDARIDFYAQSLRRLRAAAAEGRLNVCEVDSDDIAIRDTADMFKTLGIETRREGAAGWIDLAFGAAASVVSAFFLTPWETVATGLASSAASSKAHLGDRLASAVLERPRHLVKLAEAGLGRLSRGPTQ
jgi:hypothetical protein